jgi:GNAT superfamily N-acetyltransferase
VAEQLRIRPLTACSDRELAQLSDVLIDCVAGGASVSFMPPLTPQRASVFWRGVAASAACGERVLLVAEDAAGAIIGTVQLILALPENQPHRAEIAKMMTRPSHRGRGVATALMRVAEELARRHGRWLLTLDTAAEEGAAAFYERLGFTHAGTIPDYASKPHGGLTGAMIYWKRLGR